MRLLTATHYFSSHGGGIERVAERLALELSSLGHELCWLASDASPPPAHPAIAVEIVRSGHWAQRKLGIPFPVPWPRELRKISRAVATADAVLIHDCLYLSNIAAFISARRARKPVLIVQHIGTVPYRNPALRTIMALANRLIARPMLARADQVVFISELTRGEFADVRFRQAPVLAFNGMDSAIFHPGSDHARRDDRARLGVGDADRLIVFVGRFVEKKGIDIVRALARLRPDATFALAGQGPVDPAGWALPNVRLLGQLSSGELADLYRAGDLLLLPSVGEGFPLVIQEALACGLPVLCGADTAQADSAASRFLAAAIVDQQDRAATIADFGAALGRQLGVPSSAAERAERSAFAIERYSWQRVGRLYDRLLRALPFNRDTALAA
jgi:glycosyltransferase involved in cell wall biosynthesis